MELFDDLSYAMVVWPKRAMNIAKARLPSCVTPQHAEDWLLVDQSLLSVQTGNIMAPLDFLPFWGISWARIEHTNPSGHNSDFAMTSGTA